MKIEGYAREFADFLALFAEYSAGQKKTPHQTDLKAEAKLKEMFSSGRNYPPSHDEGYPLTYEDDNSDHSTKKDIPVEFDGRMAKLYQDMLLNPRK